MRADTKVELPTPEQVAVAAETLQLLGDPTRLKVLWALLHGEQCVNELARLVGAQPPAVSQHLAKLRLARLVQSRREGTRIFYVADNVHVHQLLREALYHADHIAQGLPDHGPTA
jgi:DNA-binding transcriptional ArsR family regulator